MSNIGVPLHNHSEGSFLDGYASVRAIAKRTSEIGGTAFAITDHGEVNQHLAAQKAAAEFGLKFIPGIEGYLVDSIARVREESDRKNSHLCMFAENNEGLNNLWALSSRAYTEGRYYKPLVDWEMLDGNTSGIIATDGCMLAYMARAILEDDQDAAANLIGQYVDTFGRDNFFMELHTWQFIEPKTADQLQLNADMTKINQGKAYLADRYKIPMIVVNDSHYANECDWENHGLVWDMSTHGNDDKTDRGQTAAWIMDDDEMRYWMGRHGIEESITNQALQNTAEIAARCTAKIEGRLHLPSLTGSPEGDRKLFLDRIEIGFQNKVVDKGLPVEQYMERVEEEVALIVDKEFDGYFNIVADYVAHAKESKKMLVGAGRGSGGGSLVNFLMGITSVDPIKYDLLFSRFLNPARVDMPDIDVDFPQSRRKEMTEGYLPDKYGSDHVCLIGTLTRSQPKGISKDLCRAMGIPFSESKEITAVIDSAYLPQGVDAHESWELIKNQKWGNYRKHEKESDQKKTLSYWNNIYPELFIKIDEMVGLIRQSSTHAAGVLISDTPLLGEIPLRVKGSSNEMPITQFENSETKSGNADVSALGYIKYDFLGLRTLDTLEEAFQLVKERHGLTAKDSTEFYENFGDKEYQDRKTWDMVAKGDTLGIFQIETSNALASVKKMRPQNEVDMADLTSVIRPGVVQAGMLDVYFRRKNGEEDVTYPHPLMESIVKRTYGIVVYQEQALKVFLQIANYSPAEAEKVRKMIGKKLVEKMNEEKPRFIQRCLDNPEFMAQMPRGKQPTAVANEIWHNVEATGSYAFNEAHAIGYSLTACQCAYMKANYPEEFVTALLRTDLDPVKQKQYLSYARKRGFKILPPDINESRKQYTLTDEGIRFGMASVFGVGDSAFTEINKHRPFKDFDDFINKVSKRSCNAKVMKSLISIGAFDAFGDRASLLQNLFDQRKIKDGIVPDFNDESVVQAIEKELVGTYILVDPMHKYSPFIDSECLKESAQIDVLHEKQRAFIGGEIVAIKYHTTKKGDPMAWIKIEWAGEIFEVMVWPKAFAGYKYWIQEGAPVVCTVEKLEEGCHLIELMRLDRS